MIFSFFLQALQRSKRLILRKCLTCAQKCVRVGLTFFECIFVLFFTYLDTPVDGENEYISLGMLFQL
jgi:hypothetical protein